MVDNDYQKATFFVILTFYFHYQWKEGDKEEKEKVEKENLEALKKDLDAEILARDLTIAVLQEEVNTLK